MISSYGHRDRETPKPIPNLEAKPVHDMKYYPAGWESVLSCDFILILLLGSRDQEI